MQSKVVRAGFANAILYVDDGCVSVAGGSHSTLNEMSLNPEGKRR